MSMAATLLPLIPLEPIQSELPLLVEEMRGIRLLLFSRTPHPESRELPDPNVIPTYCRYPSLKE